MARLGGRRAETGRKGVGRVAEMDAEIQGARPHSLHVRTGCELGGTTRRHPTNLDDLKRLRKAHPCARSSDANRQQSCQ